MPPPHFVEKSSASGKFFSINSSHVFKDSRHTSDSEEFRHIVCFQVIAELAFCWSKTNPEESDQLNPYDVFCSTDKNETPLRHFYCEWNIFYSLNFSWSI